MSEEKIPSLKEMTIIRRLVITVACLMLLSSCEFNKARELDGHTYLACKKYGWFGIIETSYIHDPDCKCKDKHEK